MGSAMDTILRLHAQDPTGLALQHYFEDADPTLESVDHISNLIVESFGTHGTLYNGNEYGTECLLLVRAVLKASPEEGDGLARRSQVLKGAISWLARAGNQGSQHGGSDANNAPLDEVAGKLVNALIDVGQSFDQEALVKSVNTMTDIVREQRHPQAQMFALFSRFLVIASSFDSVLLADTSENISGAEFRDIILDRICTAPWNHRSVLSLVTALADVDMESKQLEMVVVKIMKQFKHVDAADLPVLIYNLLLLSSKGHQRLVLRGTLEFFDRLDAGGTMAESLVSENPKGAARLAFPELSAIESTVILHFSFAVKQDQELGTELLKHMKSGKTAYLSSFSLACLMTMARIHRFSDSVMDYLKSTILSAFKDSERLRSESWVSDFQGMSQVPIKDMFSRIIRKIPFGLEQLTPSIVQCGVYIMDSMAPTSPWRASDKDVVKKLTPKTPNERGCELGAFILAEIFQTQVSARTEILDHIMSRVVTKSTSTVFFLQLLESIVADSSEALQEHLPRIKESFDYLSFLSLSTAVRLMAAVKDVAKTNRSFRDSLILILRKALFSKTLESRQVALSGFLLLLGPSPKPSLSMRSGSSRAALYNGSETEMPSGYTMEIMGMLRRCLGQQGEVRLSLYLGLVDLVETASNLNPIIFEILQAHFAQFYDRTGTRLSPLKLEECVANSKTGGEPTFVEPLHYLMSGVVRSLVSLQKLKRRASPTDDDSLADEQSVSDCHRDLDRILLGLERAGLEDFELDKTSDFNMANNIGARNNMYATLLTGCYESAIEYVVLRQSSQSESSAASAASHGKNVASQRRKTSDHVSSSTKLAEGSSELILQLFGKMRKLHDIVKEKVVTPRAKKLGPLGEASVLGLECVTKLMEFMFEDGPEGPDEDALRLRANDDFVYYISTVVHVLLTKLNTSTGTLRDSDYDYCRRLSSVLVREYIVSERQDGPKAIAAGAKGKDKSKSLLMVGIEALTAGLLTIQRFYAVDPSPASTPALAHPERFQSRKVVSSFLAATLPQVHGGHGSNQHPTEIVAWTTSRTIRYDIDSLAAAYIQYLQGLVVMFVNETIPLLKEVGGLLGMIQILAKYLSRGSKSVETASRSAHQDRGASVSRVDADVISESETSNINHLDQLVHWLVKLCRDQAMDDATLTKTLLSMMLQLEQSGTDSQANSNLALTLFSSPENSSGAGPSTLGPSVAMSGSLGFGHVTASSVSTHCPEAAVRLRLAADVLLTYGLNYGGPQVPSLQELPERVPPGEADEEIVRLIHLKREIGVEARFAVVTMRTSGAVTEVLLQQVERSLEGLEWALGKLRYCGLVHSGSEGWNTTQSTTSDRTHMDSTSDASGSSRNNNNNNRSNATPKKSVQEFETEICWRVEICVWVLVRISQACINQLSSEHLIRVLQRCYKILTALTKYYLTPPTAAPLNLFASPSSSLASSAAAFRAGSSAATTSRKTAGGNNIRLAHGFLRVTQVAGLELSKHLYSFLSYFQMLDVEQKARAQERGGNKGGKKNGGGGGQKGKKDDGGGGVGRAEAFGGGGGAVKSRQKAKILRESKLIPTLIFGVEQYERYVIQLSKKAKVNLTQFMRRSTARDFRIQIQRLGDLGLEDRYEEEQQQLMMQRQEDQQQRQPRERDRDVAMMSDDDGVSYDHDNDMEDAHEDDMAQEEDGRDDQDDEMLVRSRKRVKHET